MHTNLWRDVLALALPVRGGSRAPFDHSAPERPPDFLVARPAAPKRACLGCGGPAPLTVDRPLHLKDHLDAATIVGSEVPDDIPEPVEWRFDEPQPDWRPATPTGG